MKLLVPVNDRDHAIGPPDASIIGSTMATTNVRIVIGDITQCKSSSMS
ncbi:MAG TPA: hypothetical protein VFI24_13770 [Pyrinomonadaceae bacterium]|nr:hypothetical protein [Pyrinomonadaceae bacterium]